MQGFNGADASAAHILYNRLGGISRLFAADQTLYQ